MKRTTLHLAVIEIVLVSGIFLPVARGEEKIRVSEDSESVRIDTDALFATIRKTQYVSGIKAGSFLDKKTGARDLGFGLHIQDWLMAPGWRDYGYSRDPKLHGNLPKHIVEGPQLCTQAKCLPVMVIRGIDFVAVQMRHTYTQPGEGYKAGSHWLQMLIFQPDGAVCLECRADHFGQ